jgi:hypothetical protein
VNEEEIRRALAAAGTPAEDVVVITNRQGQAKGFGYARLADEAAVRRLMACGDVRVAGRVLVVSRAKPGIMALAKTAVQDMRAQAQGAAAPQQPAAPFAPASTRPVASFVPRNVRRPGLGSAGAPHAPSQGAPARAAAAASAAPAGTAGTAPSTGSGGAAGSAQ